MYFDGVAQSHRGLYSFNADTVVGNKWKGDSRNKMNGVIRETVHSESIAKYFACKNVCTVHKPQTERDSPNSMDGVIREHYQ